MGLFQSKKIKLDPSTSERRLGVEILSLFVERDMILGSLRDLDSVSTWQMECGPYNAVLYAAREMLGAAWDIETYEKISEPVEKIARKTKNVVDKGKPNQQIIYDICKAVILERKNIHKGIDEAVSGMKELDTTMPPEKRMRICSYLVTIGVGNLDRLKFAVPFYLGDYLFRVQQCITLFRCEELMVEHRRLVQLVGASEFYFKLLASNLTVSMLISWLPPQTLLPELIEIIISYDCLEGERLFGVGSEAAENIVYRRLEETTSALGT